MINLLDYGCPSSFNELWAAFDKAEPPVVFCAGGTDLIPKTRREHLPPATWIDIRNIPELQCLEVDGDGLRLGACLTHHRLATSDLIQDHVSALAAACSAVGSRQIRAVGTLGGNVANASPCADSALALIALGARAVLRSSDGLRELPVDSLALGPGQTVFNPGEILECFLLPRMPNSRSAFLKLGPRRAHAVAKVSVATSAILKEGKLFGVRLALGSVGPTIIRITEAEAALEGHDIHDGLISDIAAMVENAIQPIDDARSTAWYRRVTSGVLAVRALGALVDKPCWQGASA